jgi:hypothetical protein
MDSHCYETRRIMPSSNRQFIDSPQVWSGQQMLERSDWVFKFSPKMLQELKRATQLATVNSLLWNQVNCTNFNIPETAGFLNNVATFLESGPGLARIQGIDVESLTEPERRIMFNGIGHHLGTPVSMSRDGMMMSDVTDEGAKSAERYGHVKSSSNDDFLSSRARVHSTGQLRFHNDRCDVVALMCVSAAAEGGESRLASVPKIHNKMLEKRPDLLELLFEDFDRSRLGEEFGDNANWYSIPILAELNGQLTSHYSRTFIEAAQLQPGVKKMTSAQWEAIEVMHEVADEVSFETDQAPGEIQLLNNHVVFHGRNAYKDGADSQKRRLLHRLWISMPNSRALPECYEVLFRDTRAGALRGGILPSI